MSRSTHFSIGSSQTSRNCKQSAVQTSLLNFSGTLPGLVNAESSSPWLLPFLSYSREKLWGGQNPPALMRLRIHGRYCGKNLAPRAGRVCELTRPSRSKFKMVWHQFSAVQFPSHRFVWKVSLVHFMRFPVLKSSVSSVSCSLTSVQFDVQFSGSP